jgi:hypothetical protein
MLGKADIKVTEALAAFAEFGVEPSFIVPTETGMNKSIMDAHQGLRRFLKTHGIHDFESQGLGAQENGVKYQLNIVKGATVLTQELSLYRPKTKEGDPRLWTNIRGFAKPGNLLAFFVSGAKDLYLVNCSEISTFNSRHEEGSALNLALVEANRGSETSEKLLSMLKAVSARGWIQATKEGDTAVGHTLETALGIKANSSKLPDFLGLIELKSGRVGSLSPQGKRRSSSKKSLFSKVPNWKLSPLSAGEILRRFGSRDSNGRLNLSVTVSSSPNRQGLFVLLDEASGHVVGKAKTSSAEEVIVVWELEDLQEDLGNKHKETFWVEAESRFVGSKEQFRYVRVQHTQKPLIANLGHLIAEGVITMDFTLSEKLSGGVRDHGYLFRIDPKNLGLLFPSLQSFDL